MANEAITGIQSSFTPVTLFGPNGQQVTATSQQQETTLESEGYKTTSTNGTQQSGKPMGNPPTITFTKTDPKTGKTDTKTASSKEEADLLTSEGYETESLPTPPSGEFSTVAKGNLFS